MGAAQHWGKTYKSTHMKTMMSRYVKYKNDPAWQQSQIPAHERPPKPTTPNSAYKITPRSSYDLSLLPQFDPKTSSSEPADLTSNAFIQTYTPLPRAPAINHLSTLFSIPSSLPPLSPELTAQMFTHPGSKEAIFGTEPHNARLAFLGRRLLEMHFQMFMLQAKRDRLKGERQIVLRDGEQEEVPEELMSKILEHRFLGRMMKRKWNIDEFMVWNKGAPGASPEHERVWELPAVRGSTVESIIGGLSHAYGAPVTSRLFYLDILPQLKCEMPEWTHDAIDAQRERVLRQGGLWGEEGSDGSSSKRVESGDLEVEQRV